MRRMVVGLAATLRLVRAAGAGLSSKARRQASLSRICLRSLAIWVAAPLLAAGLPAHGCAKTLAAWVQLVGPGRQASIRAIVPADASCPILTADGEPLAMRVRAEAGPIFNEGKLPPRADFPVRVCETLAPEGKKRVLLDDQPLPLPAADIRRIAVFGDTGCRIKNNKEPQDCRDTDKWPYAKVARHAAQAMPDLVVHVGDYLYRESCDVTACADMPTGYGWDVWNADFFTPSLPLFSAAPWIMVRGNHESCSRAAEGWFRFLDHGQPEPSCAAMTPFFVADLGSHGFVVMDSSAVAGVEGAEGSARDNDDDDDAASAPAADLIEKIRSRYQSIAQSIPAHAWLLTHSPFYGIRRDKTTGENRIDNTIEVEAIGGMLSPNIEMIASGHIHVFEALSFGRTNPQWPPQLIVGTGGDKLAKKPDEPDSVLGVKVDHSLIVKHFAYMILDRDGADWKGTLFDEDGAALAQCRLSNRDLACRKER